MKKILLVLILTLTIFVGVFPLSVEAQVLPWNVTSQVRFCNDVFCYDLANNVTPQNSKIACLGKQSKWELYQELLQLPLEEDAIYHYLLPNFGKITRRFDYVNKQRVDATVTFDKGGFTFHNGQDGVSIDKRKLFESILQGKSRVELPLIVDKAVTVDMLKSQTVVKSKFTTTYPNSNANRCHNIVLATESINGVTVGVGEKFSFNQVVGKRTQERGYKNAKVILDGAYVDGVGGGVCQVSTTLYNALLLAGFVPKANQHTLISNYVLAGFDAMVSDGGADLTFVNDTNYPIFIQGKTQNKSVTFTIFGLPNDYQIERVSNKQVDPFDTITVVDKQKYPHLVYDDQTEVVTNGSDGVKTQSFLNYYFDGKLVCQKLIRQNSYKKVNKVVAIGYLPRSAENADQQEKGL